MSPSDRPQPGLVRPDEAGLTSHTPVAAVPAPRVELQYSFATTAQRSRRLSNPLLDLLLAVRDSGSISKAAGVLGLSYRHTWGQLKAWEQRLGQTLIEWERGQSARLTPFADKLLWAERLAQARLAPQIEALQAELDRALATVFDPSIQVLSLHASHDDALSALQELAPQQAGLHLDIQFTGSVDAIRALNEGRCQMAGFHTRPEPGRLTLTARTYKPLLRPGKHKIIGFALRTVGLVVAAGNPLRLTNLGDTVAQQARWVNRPLGTGTRVLLDEQLRQTGLRPEQLNGYDRCEPSHAAVAQAVASGRADVGLGLQSAAEAAGLGFVPLLRERYQLVCLKSELGSPAVRSLQALLTSPLWPASLSALPGYEPDHPGTVQSMSQWLPWWRFRTPAHHTPEN